MVTRTFLANSGDDRLVVSTICTHLFFFHEAGFEYRTERKVITRFAWWSPATWRGFKWRKAGDAAQPRDMRCIFNHGADPLAFGVTSQSSPGYFKLSCDDLFVRRHCVWVVGSNPAQSDPEPAVADGARKVREISLRFTYDGQTQAVHHKNPRRTLAAN